MVKNIKIPVIALALILLLFLLILLKPWYFFIKKTLQISIVKTAFSFNSIKKYDYQVNILILGISGGNHEGPNLSDSIIVANYNFKTNRLITISVPRDIWSDSLEDKINSAYAYGEAKEKGGGLKLAKAEISSVIGQPISYAVVINFDEFEKLINFLGGIDVNVERSFVDNKFPIAGKENDLCNGDLEYKCRWEKIIFHKGIIHMDGETALKFVRSRNAEGEEGSDFARGKRQQKVIEAVKNKIINIIFTYDINKNENLYQHINNSLSRDISNQQLAIIMKNIFLKNFIFRQKFNQKNFLIGEELFEVPDYSNYEGKYVLIPKKNDISKIHFFINCLLEKGEEKKCL